MRKSLFATGLSALLATCIFAQTTNAILGGTVSDSSGALIPGVTITATNTGTGIVNTVVSNESGAYNFAALQTGTYKVSAELPGFQTQIYPDVTLGVSQQVRLNFTLQVGTISQALEVTVAADTLLATSSASVGSVLPEYKVRDLPLAFGNVIDLINTTPGAAMSNGYQGNFAGSRISQTNATRDGVVVVDGRYEDGAYSVTFESPDLIEEVRVIVAPSDAETSRGSGQVQMVTRSGTNQFRGSVYWTSHNSALDANSWFNNFKGNPKNYDNRNEYGVRFGGPIIKNKTFFFAFFEGQRDLKREAFTGNTLTATAKQGIFRFFPGVQNGNASSTNPAVDFNGNAVAPRGATGPLQSISVFGRDPLRPTFDNSAYMKETLARMPAANDFTLGDGLNTAGVRFIRRVEGLDLTNGNGYDVNRDQYNLRIDHNFNAKNKITLVGSNEKTWGNADQGGRRSWPTAYDGLAIRRPSVYSISFVSTLSASMVNEVIAGRRLSHNYQWPSADRPGDYGKQLFQYVPVVNGIPIRPVPIEWTSFIIHGGYGVWRESYSPIKQIGDNLSWTHGKHAFKGGGEWRFTESSAYTDPDVNPRVMIGAGGDAVTGLDSTSVPGIGANQAAAQNLLLDLSGSIGTVFQFFGLKNAKDPTFYGYPDVTYHRRIWYQTEFSGYLKDTWKLRPNFTVNYGAHWEYFGSPYEKDGLAAVPVSGKAVGGYQALCGVTCTGSLTSVQFVGKNSPNPGVLTNKNDWNNWAPAVGFSWNLPWFGKDKTVLRAGYGISYSGALRNFITVDQIIGLLPGATLGQGAQGASLQPPSYTSLSTVGRYLPLPRALIGLPEKAPAPIPVTDRSLTAQAYDYVTPYIQNWSLEIQRELAQNTTIEVRYIGTKGTKLWGGIPLNSVDIFNNGILDAFNTTRGGGNAALFDRMLMGINLGGGVVNGTTLTGSAALRTNNTTKAMIANGNVGALADFLNRNNTGTGENGGLLRRNGFPENYIVLNPQFNGLTLRGNPSNSTYHSLQMQFTKRLSHGFTQSASYVWSKALGEADGDAGATYRDPRNRGRDKARLGFDQTHAIVSNGTWELPFGPNRSLFKDGPSWVSRIVEKWQLGGIFNWHSGQPLTITSGLSTLTQSTTGMSPDVVGDFPHSTGKVTKAANGVFYFPGLQQIPDPSVSNVTTLQGTNGSFTNKAITDAQGQLLLVNAQPGTIGTLGLTPIMGPSYSELDINLIKRIRITETKEFQFRIDSINALNHPNFSNPNVNMNDTRFGSITSTTGTLTSSAGSRVFVTSLRLNF
ncbi:MAG: hypothetical protein DMG14_23595 [Acidobacteria bacterium]|nr:MAG: hypothetical protein DMG14_23595 [Acidobacteriota bacterium]